MVVNKLTCKDCNVFRKLDDDEGICLSHGYHVKTDDEICVDFER